jgi:hypothetical protein
MSLKVVQHSDCYAVQRVSVVIRHPRVSVVFQRMNTVCDRLHDRQTTSALSQIALLMSMDKRTDQQKETASILHTI